MREIGSEFWKQEQVQNGKDHQTKEFEKWSFYMSGRTALDSILKDLINEKEGRALHALLPSYCCESMVNPFELNGFKIDYYDVDLSSKADRIYEIESLEEYDVLLLVNYFGLNLSKFKYEFEMINKAKGDCKIIIDSTHSWISNTKDFESADYIFASLRKWTGLYTGGMAKKVGGNLPSVSDLCNLDFLNKRQLAMQKKRKYIEENSGEKELFLKLFGEAEEVLDENYSDFSMDEESLESFFALDLKSIAEQRKNNYEKLLSAEEMFLEKKIIPLSGYEKDSVPLCFPVYVEGDGRRNQLRQLLIKNNIYCPVHWPALENEEIKPKTADFIDHELSIVCDQRYTTADMERIINVIKEF